MEKLKKQYQIEILDYATDDLLDCEIEFTEKEAIQTAEKGVSNDTYCLISELEQDYEGGNYSTTNQDYIKVMHNKIIRY